MFTYSEFEKLLLRFKHSELTINNHLREGFPLFQLITYQIRYLHLISFLLLVSVEGIETTYFYIQLLHATNLILLSLINSYIMLYCNTPTTEFVIQGIKTTATFLGGNYMIHNGLSVYFLPPNAVSNAYHIYSPTGRGYGAYSFSQLLAVDTLKGAQGSRFKISDIVDSDKMLDNNRIAKVFKNEQNLPKLSEFLAGKTK